MCVCVGGFAVLSLINSKMTNHHLHHHGWRFSSRLAMGGAREPCCTLFRAFSTPSS